MIDPCPCNGCTERFTACSDRCPKDARGEFGHHAWKEQHQAQQKHLADNKYRFCIPESAAREKRNTHYTKHPVTGHKGGIQ
jgi:hypothetical protein